jgi:hypothetical protein
MDSLALLHRTADMQRSNEISPDIGWVWMFTWILRQQSEMVLWFGAGVKINLTLRHILLVWIHTNVPWIHKSHHHVIEWEASLESVSYETKNTINNLINNLLNIFKNDEKHQSWKHVPFSQAKPFGQSGWAARHPYTPLLFGRAGREGLSASKQGAIAAITTNTWKHNYKVKPSGSGGH